jgi:hypothetical protein
MIKGVCFNKIACVAVAFGCFIATGCGDVGDPKTDRAIGQAEVGIGRTMQVVGRAALVRSEEPTSKAIGGAAVAAGVMLEQDGKARIERANKREYGGK